MKFKERAKSQFEGPSKYIRLKDGESVTGVLRGEIVEHFVVWVNKKPQPAEPSQPGAKTKYRINMVISEDGKFVAKILDFGVMLYDHFYELSLNMDLEKTKLKISRKGADTNTVYLPIPLGPVDAKTLDKIAAVDLNVLNVQKKPEDSPIPPDFGPPVPWDGEDNESLPF